MIKTVALVGNPNAIHAGAHFANAARSLGLQTSVCNSDEAYIANLLWRKVNWWLLDHRPARLNAFSDEVVSVCEQHRPAALLTTGLAPVSSRALNRIRRLNISLFNFLTDDPWNRAHRAEWFFDAVPYYDAVFSPRRSNLDDLKKVGCRAVKYLPFGYAPEIHFPYDGPVEDLGPHRSDVMFAGGADSDRLPYMRALAKAGINLALYGNYWDRHSEFRQSFRGHADPEVMRKAVAAAKVCLCLVRRANRDGHAMRTFELAAMKACMLVEDSDEHREFFGTEGESVLYFRSIGEMLSQVKWLIANETERHRLAANVRQRITSGAHTYADRLKVMIDFA